MTLKIESPLTLPCGLTLPNRLAKVAMAENWSKKHLPHKDFSDTYGVWTDSGWGLVMSGNVQVDIGHLGNPKDMVLGNGLQREEQLAAWKTLTAVTKKNGAPFIVQLNHPGRQATLGAGNRGLFAKTIAPSVVPVNIGDGWIARAMRAIIFGSPREMTEEDIKHVISCFVEASKLASEAGCDGVEIHAAHGYLLSQFMSGKTNLRTDEYGGSPKNRSRIIVEIIQEIRKAVPKTFCVGIKFNSVDHQSKNELAQCIEQLEDIVNAGVDFLEISGGTYEDPKMVSGYSIHENAPPKASTVAREAFFLAFAQAIRDKFAGIPLMVTGGFRTRNGMEEAVRSGACDLVGIGRPAVLYPDLPRKIIFNSAIPNSEAVLKTNYVPSSFLGNLLGVKMLARGVETMWYSSQIQMITKGNGA